VQDDEIADVFVFFDHQAVELRDFKRIEAGVRKQRHQAKCSPTG
jgi:hypothetical protein